MLLLKTDDECSIISEKGGNGKETYRKLVFSADGDRLIGAVFIGDISNAGLYRSVIRDHKNLDEIKEQIIDHQLHYSYLLYARTHA